jgi:hypothetical protein
MNVAEILSSSSAQNRPGREREPDVEASLASAFPPQSIAAQEPASSFEVLSNFFPETYTIEQRLPSSLLMVVTAYEQSCFPDRRTNFYRLLYFKSPRQWHRLEISITVCPTSIYWTTPKLSKHEYKTQDAMFLGQPASLPSSLRKRVQKLLLDAEDLDDDIYIRFRLSDQDNIQTQNNNQNQESQVYSLLPAKRVRSTPQDILTLLDDLGCRHYYENQLIQVAIIEPPTRFATWANSMLVYETKFARAVPSDELLYNVRLLRCMEGISVFAKLVGIVVDVSGKHLKSYLIKFPRTKWKLINDELRSDGGVMPWKRRE